MTDAGRCCGHHYGAHDRPDGGCAVCPCSGFRARLGPTAVALGVLGALVAGALYLALIVNGGPQP